MFSITENISYFKNELPTAVRLIAVSKTKPVRDIMEAYNAGQRYFGENRVQELLTKRELLPSDIEWHLIGHLQSNKVKYLVPFITMIQSVDSYKLLVNINSEAFKLEKAINCLLQIHIAAELTKFGFSMNELRSILHSNDVFKLNNVRICGVMGMATYTTDTNKIKSEFGYLKCCFQELKDTYFKTSAYFKEISMGMSGDYKIAIQEGSTIIRVGSLIFGERK